MSDRAADIREDAIYLASNLVDDFSETDNDAPEMPRDLQIRTVTASIMELVLDVESEAAEIINGLKRGSCWCEMGIGNPMMKTHSAACDAARAFVARGGDE